MGKPILCLDFDGVVHSYSSGWHGAGVVSDPPVPGAIVFLKEATAHFRVAIFSSRSHQPGGVRAMQRWLEDHVRSVEAEAAGRHLSVATRAPAWLDAVEWPTEKPSALVTLDDRAITFDGTWPDVGVLLNFEPWNKKRPAA